MVTKLCEFVEEAGEDWARQVAQRKGGFSIFKDRTEVELGRHH